MTGIDALIVIVYVAGIVLLGSFMKSRAGRNIESYFLGSRELPWWALAMSGSTSYFDITGTMWIVSLFFVLGLKGMWVQWIWGFPITVFYMAYMGKWIRRSGVMTGAEWMRTRFGSGAAGELARIAYTVFAIMTITVFLAYDAFGMGKFGHVFLSPAEPAVAGFLDGIGLSGVREAILPLTPLSCAILILGTTGIYVILGGLRGIVVTEIVQTIVLTAGALLIAFLGWSRTSYASFADRLPGDWISIAPVWTAPTGQDAESAYFFFGALVLAYVAKGLLLDLSGPEQLYDFQRFLAVRSARDACKLGALWGALHTVRWPMAMALAALAIGVLGMERNAAIDAESVLPRVIHECLPAGLRGFALAALLSAFLTTFNSTVNGGASYLVRDVYGRFIAPRASERHLVRASYAASALLIITGIAISTQASSIAQIFEWIMMTLGAGVLLPNVLRWYWWRMNGWGYAIASLAGMLLSLVQVRDPWLRALPLYESFPLIAGAVTLVAVAATYATRPTDEETLLAFYRTVRPFGLWGPVARLARERGLPIERESARRDLTNVAIGLPCVLALYTFPLYFILHRYIEAAIGAAIAAACAVALYFTWYRHLPRD